MILGIHRVIIFFACYFFDYCSKRYHMNENIFNSYDPFYYQNQKETSNKFINVFTTSKVFVVLTCINTNLEL